MIHPQIKPKRVLDSRYVKWIKSQPCLVVISREQLVRRYGKPPNNVACFGPIDPHHVIPAGGGKTGSKVDDKRCVPLCRFHHDLAERREWFQAYFDIDLEKQITLFNLEYTFQQKKAVKRVERTPKAEVEIQHCPCGKRHVIPFSKVSMTPDSITFRCPLSSKSIVAGMKGRA